MTLPGLRVEALRAMGLAWLLVHFALLYFSAATASLYDDRVPGISGWRVALRPAWPLLALLLWAALPGPRRPQRARRAAGLAGAAAVCSGLLLAVAPLLDAACVSQRTPPPALGPFLRHALVHPCFSNRSAVGTGASLSGALLVAALCLRLSLPRSRPALFA